MSQTEPQETATPSAAAAPPGSRHWLLISIGAVAAGVAIVVATMYWPASSPPPPPSTVTGIASHTVLYEAEGADAPGLRSATYTIQTDSGGTSQGETDLPMKNKAGGTGLSFTNFKTGDFVYLSVQNSNAAGSVTCRITVGDLVIAENTSTGGYAIATCKGTVR